MNFKIALLVLLVVIGVGFVKWTSTPTKVVDYDMGGEVQPRMAEIEQLRKDGTKVVIRGECVSSCTLYLALPKTCVMPTAKLGFHGPSSRWKGIPLPRAEFERVSRLMATYYPPMIEEWFLKTGRMITEEYYVISGADAVKMGARPCP